MDELRDRLKIEFPLQASPIEKGNRDDVVHIYYKVWWVSELSGLTSFLQTPCI